MKLMHLQHESNSSLSIIHSMTSYPSQEAEAQQDQMRRLRNACARQRAARLHPSTAHERFAGGSMIRIRATDDGTYTGTMLSW